MREVQIGLCLLAVMPWIGCVGKASLRGPAVKLPVQATPREQALSHLVGQWELPGKDGKMKLLIFEPGGQLRFQGGLEYYNPAMWRLDADRQELIITLPQTPDSKLDIFTLYVGDGVTAFDRRQKQVTYHFNPQIWELNVAGWTYHKPDNPDNSNNPAAPPLAEPVFK